MNSSLHIILFTHYSLYNLYGKSMSRFSELIAEGMEKRGHIVEYWKPPTVFGYFGKKIPFLYKWLGYIDQYVLFPLLILWRIRYLPPNSLMVFSDQALGLWVPFVKDRPHVIHCHDFLALRGSLGEILHYSPGFMGRLYQRLIRWGFSQGKYFISVSKATQDDLHRLLQTPAKLSTVVHNPLNSPFSPLHPAKSWSELKELWPDGEDKKFIMHIGSTWYKNRLGVLQIFEQLAFDLPEMHLIMISKPTNELLSWLNDHPQLNNRINFHHNITFRQLQALYSLAEALVFPSLYEGFGWPVLEALSCGCPVVTTNAQPMTEVGGDVAYYISTYPDSYDKQVDWAKQAADLLQEIFALPSDLKEAKNKEGIDHASGFSLEHSLLGYEQCYQNAMGITVG
ncbi:glycosyltransferase family 4 protein [Acaryochloris marina NIES-2412]|uniref:glycosyltransferase family 4 protein n=1 Tax=Acaryochloris marina TaxID=155978 RepID=UPI004058A9D5